MKDAVMAWLFWLRAGRAVG